MNKKLKNISVIGCGRWGAFLSQYFVKHICESVTLYGKSIFSDYQELLKTRKNQYLNLSDNTILVDNLEKILESEIIVISIGCQNLRELCKEINQYNVSSKSFVLCMKGIEKITGRRLTEIVKEEITQDIKVAIFIGPGQVQDYLNDIPLCMLIDSDDENVKKELSEKFSSNVISVEVGNDLVGNEIGAATKNIMGIAAGMLDGINCSGLKGALIVKGIREFANYIEKLGGKKESACGLAHLGDYEATLFSHYGHNRAFGEHFAKGEKFEKLAEGVDTLKAVHEIAKQKNIPMPICNVLYSILFENSEVKKNLLSVFRS